MPERIRYAYANMPHLRATCHMPQVLQQEMERHKAAGKLRGMSRADKALADRTAWAK